MKRKLLSASVALVLMLQIMIPITAVSAETAIGEASDSFYGTSNTAYSTYAEKNGGISYGDGTEILLSADSFILEDTNDSKSFSFNVENDGWYTVNWDYRSLGEGSNNHQVAVMVDGKYPFTDLQLIEIPRMWLSGKISVLDDGTQVRGNAVADETWSSYTIYDNTGLVADPYMIYFSKGTHTVDIKMLDGMLELRNIKLVAYKGLPSYEDYEKEHNVEYNGKPLDLIEAESFVRTNSLSITAASDLSSSLTTPYSYADQLLNVMGGTNWQYTGQRAEWKVNVKEAGLYRITLRYKQSYKDNMKAYRKLLVNGEVPFKEALAIPFKYNNVWDNCQPEWAVWLNEGENTIALEVTAGEAAVIMSDVNDVVQKLNTIYRRILMLTGTTPDSYRDYHLEEEIPGIREEFSAVAKQLGELLKNIENLYSSTSSFSVVKDTQRQLEDMAENIRTVTKSGRLGRFKSNISSLASLGQSLREQPLQIDSITLSSPKGDYTPKKEGFFARMKHKWLRFIVSFSDEYNVVIGSGSDKSLTVWTSLGRDQLGILKSMTANDFEPKYNIDTNVQLVTGSLIQAVLAGKAPDVVLGQAETATINYAMRGALVDLTKFDDFDEVMKRFSDCAGDPFTYEGGVYALPQRQSFQMMFVRDDILAELGLDIPKTWNDFVTKIFPVLQRDNLLVGVGNLNNAGELTGIFLTLLYQYGGSLYSEDLLSSALTTPEALEAFDFAVALYNEYGVPTQYDFLNRFRTGEMPIAIADYSTYNTLQVGAPEISGLWTMVPIPGIEREDGTINNTQLMTFTGSIIIDDSEVKDEAWEFIKWWSSADVQRNFGLQQEAILGPSGRYTTANLEALEGLSWSTKQLALLEEQRNVSLALTHVPGSYYIGKSINSATVTSVNDSSLIPREELMYWVDLIDREMKRKQKEFNFTGKAISKEDAE